jgi:hypothetical protein
MLNRDLFPRGRIDAPSFFCHDFIHRTFRIVSGDKSKITHALWRKQNCCSARILVRQNRLAEYVTLYANILGSKIEVDGDDVGGKSFSLGVGVPQRA